MNKKTFAIVSTSVFALSILCSVGLFLYVGLLSGWNLQFFWILASKTLFLCGIILPAIGIPVSWHIMRAPTRVEWVLEAVLLAVCWLASLYVIYIALSFLV